MSWLVIIGGAVLAIGGGFSIVHGAPYWQIEFGWMEVIAGASTLAGGVVTMALGLVLRRLGILQDVLLRAAVSASPAFEPVGAPPAEPGLPGPVSGPAPVPEPAFDPAPEPMTAAAVPAAPTALPRETDPVPAPSRLGGWRARLWRRNSPDEVAQPSAAPAAEPGVPDQASVAHLGAMDEAPVASPPVLEGPMPPSSESPFRRVGIADTHIDAPEVVGRYQSGGASYVLFSDGTIEVETSTGRHRFSSMEELKTYIEQQEAEKAAG